MAAAGEAGEADEAWWPAVEPMRLMPPGVRLM